MAGRPIAGTPAERRDPRLAVRQERPLNAGPELAALRAQVVTPNELFFIRSHGDVPEVDAETFRLSVGGLVRRPLTLSLGEIRALPARTLTATLECAGNRRSQLIAVEPIPGELPWGEDALGNAFWTGAELARLLAEAEPLPEARHVAFGGLDEVERHGERFAFGGSIPLAKALSAEVLLAYEMNGAPLPPSHGAPLRALVPGFIGARSVKWLSRIELRETPSENYFQRRAYRLFPPAMRAETVDYEQGKMLEDLGINSVICTPRPGEVVAPGAVVVRGYAIAGGSRRVERVELSGDGGRNWSPVELFPDRGPWSWRFWRGALGLTPGSEHELVVRAWDSAGDGQPADPAAIWNFKGYMNNAWHRVRVSVARTGG
ncbi:MAG TPA: sulfite oxidase [Thermoanaerobaculia bacterium]